jgi:hypothetical protein
MLRLREVKDLPVYNMSLLLARAIINHPNHTIGVLKRIVFFRPKYPDRTPPQGVAKIPIIHKMAANHEPSFSSSLTASSASISN